MDRFFIIQNTIDSFWLTINSERNHFGIKACGNLISTIVPTLTDERILNCPLHSFSIVLIAWGNPSPCPFALLETLSPLVIFCSVLDEIPHPLSFICIHKLLCCSMPETLRKISI